MSTTAIPTWEQVTSLITYIIDKHHAYTRNALTELPQLLDEVSSEHGEEQPELLRLKAVFGELRDDLGLHLMKEEQVLFPFILAMEEARKGQQPRPMACFSTVRNPIRMMQSEHANADGLLRTLREILGRCNLTDCACEGCQRLDEELRAFDEDLMEHMHLENNLLFPRAVTLEDEWTQSPGSH
jgi:regulator of cell morphogenesis and NO signaling